MTTRSDAPNQSLAPISSRAADAARDAWDNFPALYTANAATKGMTAGNMTEWGLSGAAPKSQLPPISLGGGIPDAETQPREELLAAMTRVLDTPGDAPLVYGGPQGYRPLRDEIARFFARNHPSNPDADWYLLTNGAAGAIESICASFLDPGDVVITEIPTFAARCAQCGASRPRSWASAWTTKASISTNSKRRSIGSKTRAARSS